MRFKKEHQALNRCVFLEDVHTHFKNNENFIRRKDGEYGISAYWHKTGWFYCRISDTVYDKERYAKISIMLDYFYMDDKQRTICVEELVTVFYLFGKPVLPDVLVKKAKAGIAEKYLKSSNQSRFLDDDDSLPF